MSTRHTKIICFSTPMYQESMAMREILAATSEKNPDVEVKFVDYNWLLLPPQAHVSAEGREKADQFVAEMKKIVAGRKVDIFR